MVRPNKKEIQRVEEWNRNYRIGTEVVVTKDLGEKVDSVTRSEAYMLCGHTAVIMLEGISGCYLLEKVKAKREN